MTNLSAPMPRGDAVTRLSDWLTGLAGLLVLAIMSRKTLDVPNTQSATGILYVGVIFAFLGELSSQLLSVQSFHLV